ncbi:hypothetical protein BST61_g2156 [Cercospora zeina]
MAGRSNSIIADEEAIDENGFTVDTSDGAEAYLAYQARELKLEDGIDVLVVTSLIFHDKKILLIRLADTIKSWGGRVGTPVCRVLQAGDHGLDVILNSSIDKPLPEADDISVAEFSRVAARTQVGLDPTATALLTAVTPVGLKDTTWLRASLFWTVGEDTVPTVPKGSVATEAWWATRAEVEQRNEEEFFFGLKDDIVQAFDLRKVH